MPDADTILGLMEDEGLDLDEAKEVAELMEEYDIDDQDAAIDIYENN